MDLAGEIRRIADFLDLEISADFLKTLVENGSVEKMKQVTKVSLKVQYEINPIAIHQQNTCMVLKRTVTI